MKPTALVTVKMRLRKSSSGRIGSVALASTSGKSARSTTPATIISTIGAESLQRTKRDQLRHVLRDAAERRADEEDHDRDLQQLLAAVQIAELAVERSRHRRGEQIGGDDPGEMLDAAEIANDRRQRGRDDRLVE